MAQDHRVAVAARPAPIELSAASTAVVVVDM